jgi:hypothetical protein
MSAIFVRLHNLSRLSFLLIGLICSDQLTAEWAEGFVFDDSNRNERLDPSERGLAGVRVSNGRSIVPTDAEGRWRLEVFSDDILFVIKPSGWMTPITKDQLPRFYYLHKPQGSPDSKFPGVAPTGPLPSQINFPLFRQSEPDQFKVVFFGDPQPRDQKEIDYIAHDVVEELIGTDARFGVTLGDILFDDLSLFESFNATVGLIGVPWYNVIGNHDLNLDAPNDRFSDETFHRYYGPSYYSFDYGKVHFIVLDNVEWLGPGQSYRGGLDADQVQYVANDLKSVPDSQLVVISMHIPLTNVGNRHELYRLIEDRPYTLSLSGHTHWQAHQFIGAEDGWMGKEPHHHIVNVTVSGSWWKGLKDENGIPHTTMRDGAPNGYSILTFDGHKVTFDFKAARRSADYQMNIYAPEAVSASKLGGTEVMVNVFAGSERSKVRFRIVGHSEWKRMDLTRAHDPEYVRTRNREIALAPNLAELSAPVDSYHLWKSQLPTGLPPGTYRIEVETVDSTQRQFRSSRVLRVIK